MNKNSSTLSEQKQSFDNNPLPMPNKTIDDNSDKEQVISNTQSQQFKTVENTKIVFEDELQTHSSKDVGLKKTLKQSNSQDDRKEAQPNTVPISQGDVKLDVNVDSNKNLVDNEYEEEIK